jgi:hypothetical protein
MTLARSSRVRGFGHGHPVDDNEVAEAPRPVNLDARRLDNPFVRDGDLRPRPANLEPMRGGGRSVREAGPRPPGQHSREPTHLLGERNTAQPVHGGMHSDEMVQPKALLDCARRYARFDELPPGNDTVLARGEASDDLLVRRHARQSSRRV